MDDVTKLLTKWIDSLGSAVASSCTRLAMLQGTKEPAEDSQDDFGELKTYCSIFMVTVPVYSP